MAPAAFGSSQFLAVGKSSSSFTSSSHSVQLLRFDLNNKKPLKFKPAIIFSVRASAGDSVVTLLDYGAGNVRSVRNATRSLGFDIKDVQSPEDILNAKLLVFPGVGAFAAAMEVLNQKGLAEALCTYIKNDRPFLGICLGLQQLFESS